MASKLYGEFNKICLANLMMTIEKPHSPKIIFDTVSRTDLTTLLVKCK